jgi:uncharacterized membrane protein YtjA (UPF0391 family)
MASTLAFEHRTMYNCGAVASWEIPVRTWAMIFLLISAGAAMLEWTTQAGAASRVARPVAMIFGILAIVAALTARRFGRSE